MIDLFGEPAFEADGLLRMKSFEVAVLGVFFKPANSSRSCIDRVFAQAARLFQINEISTLDPLVFRTVFSHGLGHLIEVTVRAGDRTICYAWLCLLK